MQDPGESETVSYIAPAAGRYDIIPDWEQNDVRRFKIGIDGFVHLVSGQNSAIVPGLDDPQALEHRQVDFQFITKSFIFVGVRKEEGCHRRTLAALA